MELSNEAGHVQESTPLDESLRWLVDSLVDSAMDPTMAFFELRPSAQFLALHLLRVTQRAVHDASQVQPQEYLAELLPLFRGWLEPWLSAQDAVRP
jgi:hypothetical protein